MELNSNSNNNNNKSSKMASWNLEPSNMSLNTINPIRRLVDGMAISPNPDKDLIRLTIGDPTVFGNLDTAKACLDAVVDAVNSGKHNGYPSSIGTREAREAVAEYSTSMGAPATVEDVILTSGCSQSLELVLTLLANPGDNILIPRPGFPLYITICHSLGIQTRFYDLLPDQEWQVDLKHLEGQIDDNTKAVVVNSPSNPCGSVFSLHHIQEIIDICDFHKIPIISDEVYENVVYNGREHHPFGSVSQSVPVFSVSSVSKGFLVPGWRLGWVIVHDRQNNVPASMRKGLISLTQRTLGPCSIMQGALPAILKSTPTDLFDHTNRVLEDNCNIFYEYLSMIKGLKPIKPCGAMYMMVQIDLDCFPGFKSDVDFTERLMTEESVFCLPSTCFSVQGYFRVVLSVPQDKSLEAISRLKDFCDRHYMSSLPSFKMKTERQNESITEKRRHFNRISSSCFLKP